jgi:hypothetical protein
MTPLLGYLRRFVEPKRHSPAASYAVRVVSLPEELDFEDALPLELRFLFAVRPEIKPRIRKLLEEGRAIGVRTVLHTPENILMAVRNISILSQHNCILTWLPELLRDKHLPAFSDDDKALAARQGVDLDADVRTILEQRLKFKRLVLVDEENVGIGTEEQRLMTDLSEAIFPLAIDYIVDRVVLDNANERTEIAQSILIAHVLEHWAKGVGKVFAASTDDLLGEAAEIAALRGSGFSWRTISKRLRLLVPVFGLATFGALQVESLLEHGYILTGGAVFGLAAVALSLTTAIQSVGMYTASVRSLLIEGKLHEHQRERTVLTIALIQDFTNPARLGLLLGASLAPLMGMIAAVAGLMSNGWVLAAVGSTESIVAGLTVIFFQRINAWRFRRRLEQKIINTYGESRV